MFDLTLDFKYGENELLLDESEAALVYVTYFVHVPPICTLESSILHLHSNLDNCFEYQIQEK